ncbi:MAG TPA: hypothetical protein VK815_02915 [Candidatus Acidoferrales bacterium]|jgi:hypothetical protein|nr:hypothetical protein [Candidatus Acidoferrales bacterium]
MSIQASKVVVRFAAVVTVLVCGYFPTFLLAKFFGESLGPSRTRGGEILLVGIFSFLPILFIWESVRAWRFLPKSIGSLGAIWALAGLSGVSYGLILGFGDSWKIRYDIVTVVGLFLFLLGVWMTRQQKRLYDVV